MCIIAVIRKLQRKWITMVAIKMYAKTNSKKEIESTFFLFLVFFFLTADHRIVNSVGFRILDI